MTFKEKIINLRKIKGLTQDEFAKAVGVSRQAVYKWESGQSYPEVPKILEIKLLFNVSIDDLLDDSFDIPLPEKKKRKKSATISAKPQTEKAEEVKVSVAEVKEEPAIIEAPAEKEIVESKAEVAPQMKEEGGEAEIDEKKQRGFFSRIFGRK